MLVPRLLLFLVAAAGHTLVWVAIVNRTHAYGWNRKLVDLLMLLLVAIAAVGLWPIAQFAAGPHYPSALLQLPPLLASVWGWASLAASFVGLTHTSYRYFHRERRGGIHRRVAQPLPLHGAADGGLLSPTIPRRLGRLPGNQVTSPLRVELELNVPDLPPTFAGLKIAHLSDLHLSTRFSREYIDQIVEHTNAWQPDLVAITGDIVEHNACLDWIDQSLARLQARDARLFVLGNHDRKSDFAETRRRLVKCGFVDVGGRVVPMETRLGKMVVAGNEAPWFLPVPVVDSLASREASPDVLRLALLHTPDHFSWVQRHGFHLALAGHNHGGQVRFPLLGALVAPSIYGTRYAAGVFQSGGATMHVSPGTASYSPIRWGCPPELNLLTLRRA